jgi:hypothetical protein
MYSMFLIWFMTSVILPNALLCSLAAGYPLSVPVICFSLRAVCTWSTWLSSVMLSSTWQEPAAVPVSVAGPEDHLHPPLPGHQPWQPFRYLLHYIYFSVCCMATIFRSTSLHVMYCSSHYHYNSSITVRIVATILYSVWSMY